MSPPSGHRRSKKLKRDRTPLIVYTTVVANFHDTEYAVVNFACLQVFGDSVEHLLDAASLYGGHVFHYIKHVKQEVGVFAFQSVPPERLELTDPISPHIGFHYWAPTAQYLPNICLVLGHQFKGFASFSQNRFHILNFTDEMHALYESLGVERPSLFKRRSPPPGDKWFRFVAWDMQTLEKQEAAVLKEEKEAHWKSDGVKIRPVVSDLEDTMYGEQGSTNQPARLVSWMCRTKAIKRLIARKAYAPL
eukprot:TRINITY_DN3056_c0_g2_i2.p1 TRINITY_DN3056_c0_g2~~TRINITY_DN3056_c0_g2_i2.p1  ORF type:complete len:248 (-),score=14.08 TRINITY_DN3056_c0_g2_i2:93-836(-)